jgi:hypothetical protein
MGYSLKNAIWGSSDRLAAMKGARKAVTTPQPQRSAAQRSAAQHNAELLRTSKELLADATTLRTRSKTLRALRKRN